MTVSAYLAKAPKEVHPKLDEIRTLIRAAAPQAEERISYGIVGYFSHGVLVYFGYWKEHIGLYALPLNIKSHKAELAKYEISKGAIRFPYTKKLPRMLIRKLVKAQLKLNEAKV